MSYFGSTGAFGTSGFNSISNPAPNFLDKNDFPVNDQFNETVSVMKFTPQSNPKY